MIFVVGVALLPALAACGGSGSDGNSAGSPGAAGSTVEVKDFTFMPADLTVAPNTTVTWTFQDSAKHDVQADDGSFSSPLLRDGETYQFTFATPGSFPYTCSVHPFMKGTVTVR